MTRADRDRDHADLMAANAVLLRALARRKKAGAAYIEADRLLSDAKRTVRALIDRLKHGPEPTPELCGNCGMPQGVNPDCYACADFTRATVEAAIATQTRPPRG
jgi:hypothetical protein